ncbi:hypothetical protein OOK41_31470 [Micromonospora sp. NBC_01655]|uniref:hypothetical protein n=1 Tax=Micromonospora sp. NBC_01655 TaxID=2975983 RepID=UPI0022585171|nr:hypothetical protein [Micromonospora sp. NBC_01655]MCX4474781.1 hypothetical protein [Micromonospora sp. NBC_01655]
MLRWQPGTTAPVFFRTLRSPINRITEVAGSTMLRLVDVDILAEPFAYGLRETLAPVTVPNNPASPGGCYLDIAGVRGDVETPLYLRLGGDVMGSVYDYRTVAMGIRRRGTPSQMPMVLQAEAMTTGTATALAASNDPLMSGTRAELRPDHPTTARHIVAGGHHPGPCAAGTGSWPGCGTRDLDVWSVQLVYGNTNRPIWHAGDGHAERGGRLLRPRHHPAAGGR